MYEVAESKFSSWNGKQLTFGLRDGTTDFNCVNAIVVADEYNFRAIPFNPGDVVINIGAYIGGVSLLLASLDKDLKIYSYEPLPENFDLLQKNIRLNAAHGIFPFPLAVGGGQKKMKIYYGDKNDWSAKVHRFFGNSPHMVKEGFHEANCTTLEKIFSDNKIEKCKMLKLDCEGPEYGILRACPAAILEKVDYIVGEHHLNPRREILEATKGLFNDIDCEYQSDTDFGHFKFKNKKL